MGRIARLGRNDADGAQLVAALHRISLPDRDTAHAAVAVDDVVDGDLDGLAEHLVIVDLRDLAVEHGEHLVT